MVRVPKDRYSSLPPYKEVEPKIHRKEKREKEKKNTANYHQIPKPSEAEGLSMSWPAKDADKADLATLCEEIKSKM